MSMRRGPPSQETTEAVPGPGPNPAATAVGPREPLLIDRETLEARLEAVRGVLADPVQGLAVDAVDRTGLGTRVR